MKVQFIKKRFLTWCKQVTCNHKEWNCDNQIRIIECVKCKKRAWIRDYTDLFKHL